MPGDTLSGIAEMYGGDSSAWGDLYARNQDVVGANPDLILPGQTLSICPDNEAELTPEQRLAALTPEGFAERAAKNPAFAAQLELARDLIETGGSGTLSDGALVVEQLVKLPVEALQIMRDKNTRVVVCRNSVTDYMDHLKGVTPRGWPPGSSWDDVPGLNSPSTNEVLIAIIGHETEEGAHVPRPGEGHGSHNLVLHEALHGVDINGPGTARSSTEGFTDARDADSASITSDYLQQPGAAGRQETYAEIGARYYDSDPTLAKELPNLNTYFAGNPYAEKSAVE